MHIPRDLYTQGAHAIEIPELIVLNRQEHIFFVILFQASPLLGQSSNIIQNFIPVHQRNKGISAYPCVL